jgi:hypothetical protein
MRLEVFLGTEADALRRADRRWRSGKDTHCNIDARPGLGENPPTTPEDPSMAIGGEWDRSSKWIDFG